MKKRRVAILGSTGSIGDSAFHVLPELADSLEVVALVAGRNDRKLVAQALQLRPAVVGLIDPAAAQRAAAALAASGVAVLGGPRAAVDALRETRPDLVLAAITGAAGLESCLEAVEQGAILALANKEALVLAGHLVTRRAAETGARIVPVDSEHSAIFQCLAGAAAADVRRLFLTASGGPFRDLPLESFASITPDEALRHPTWKMGPKITVDSATMMNKALEIIEAHWLFGVDAGAIEVLLHRQSIVHSMVEFSDGSLLAQLGVPSMTVPVRYALAWPERATSRERYFDLDRFASLTFEAPDRRRFPSLDLGYRAARELGLAGTALNAASEVAVASFLAGASRFDRIPRVAGDVLDRLDNEKEPSLARILEADRWARAEAQRCLSR